MPSLSDTMLAGGCAVLVDSIHGEWVTVLSGVDGGNKFYAVREVEQDIGFSTELGLDPRAKRILRFRNGLAVPNVDSQDRIQTDDGRVWTLTRRPDSAYLTTDFEMVEVVAGKDRMLAPVIRSP